LIQLENIQSKHGRSCFPLEAVFREAKMTTMPQQTQSWFHSNTLDTTLEHMIFVNYYFGITIVLTTTWAWISTNGTRRKKRWPKLFLLSCVKLT